MHSCIINFALGRCGIAPVRGATLQSKGEWPLAPVTTPKKTFPCAVCGAALPTQRDLDNHMCLRHDDCGEARLGTPITFRCATCGEAFSRRSDLHAHLLQHGHGHPDEWDKTRIDGRRPLRRRPQKD